VKLVKSLALIVAISSPFASAHEQWLEPSHYQVRPEATIKADIRIGQNFKGYAYPYLEHETEQFFERDASGQRTVDAITGDKPAYHSKMSEDGFRWVALESKAYDLTFDSEKKFVDYINGEGLEWVLDWYKEQGKSREDVTETYYRHAKTLVSVVGSEEPDWVTEPLGHRLELIPIASFTQCASAPTFQLLWQGKPLEGALVRRFIKGKRGTEQYRTNQNGKVRFTAQEGPFLINAVRIDYGSEPRAKGNDWVSDWASLTYQCHK
jgi:uncharacterized GH25 family protein